MSCLFFFGHRWLIRVDRVTIFKQVRLFQGCFRSSGRALQMLIMRAFLKNPVIYFTAAKKLKDNLPGYPILKFLSIYQSGVWG